MGMIGERVLEPDQQALALRRRLAGKVLRSIRSSMAQPMAQPVGWAL